MNTFFKDSANRVKQQAEKEVFQLVLPSCSLFSEKIVQTERSGKRKTKFLNRIKDNFLRGCPLSE